MIQTWSEIRIFISFGFWELTPFKNYVFCLTFTFVHVVSGLHANRNRRLHDTTALWKIEVIENKGKIEPGEDGVPHQETMLMGLSSVSPPSQKVRQAQ